MYISVVQIVIRSVYGKHSPYSGLTTRLCQMSLDEWSPVSGSRAIIQNDHQTCKDCRYLTARFHVRTWNAGTKIPGIRRFLAFDIEVEGTDNVLEALHWLLLRLQ